jgi:fluoride exporter
MFEYLLVAIGSALGGVGRYWISGLIANRIGQSFPWDTIVVNITGCFIIGFFNTITGTEGRLLVPAAARTFFMIGLCGGYTTFSAFSLQTLNLTEDGQWPQAAANVFLSVILCLLGVWLGHLLASGVNAMKGG